MKYLFYLTLFRYECWCVKDFIVLMLMYSDKNDCSTPCNDNSAQICGNTNSLSAFATR
jgi:hypothetical protein